MREGWRAAITFQQRGTKEEVTEVIDFATREGATRALEALEADVLEKDANGIAVITSQDGRRISFVRQDFRRTKMYEFTSNSGRSLI